jgi:hypothetical protein
MTPSSEHMKVEGVGGATNHPQAHELMNNLVRLAQLP